MEGIIDETTSFVEPNEIHTPRNGFTLRPVTTHTAIDRPNAQNAADGESTTTEKTVNRTTNLFQNNLLVLLVILSNILHRCIQV